MSRWTDKVRISGAKGIASVIVPTLVLVGCSGVGDVDDDPTPTAEAVDAQPTVEDEAIDADTARMDADETTPSTPINTDVSTQGDLATPVAQEPGGTPDPVIEATPGVMDEDADRATPESPDGVTGEGQDAASDSIVGDGTSGAPPGDDTSAPEGESEDVVEDATPASPDAGTPVASDDPVIVESCSPDVVPPVIGDVTTFAVTADLNFRTGPGSDCDLIGTAPLPQFSEVEVVSGPVVREGEDDLEWVQVRVGDDTGWVAAGFLEPAE